MPTRMIAAGRGPREPLPECLEENTILAFVHARLAPTALADMEAHASRCPTCQELLFLALQARSSVSWAGSPRSLTERVPDARAAATAIATPTLARGTAVGRYTVLGVVGRGGMGEVYAAHDPDLDRKVALKLLHGRAAEPAARAQRLLLREAQALAKLSHPNVVTVHDVGTFEGHVFIAMEFVDGQTLSAWLSEQARGWREIRDVFAAAGRGLAAAHAAGVVHRDFKPQNVMVERGGRVVVMDFGLAQIFGSGNGPAGAPEDQAVEPTPPLAAVAPEEPAGWTDTGALAGTPRYMAPEQFLRRRIDARTDQFSFCVALFEALFKDHPFGPASLNEISRTAVSGAAPSRGDALHVPRWMRGVVRRGLRPLPGARYASMADLLRALDHDARVRRRVLAAAAACLVLAVAGVEIHRAWHPRPIACSAGAARLAGVWEAQGAELAGSRRAASKQAFAAKATSVATQSWDRVAHALDGYAGRWTAMYTDACEATHLRGEQSAEVLDLRMDCLEASRRSLDALTALLAIADATTVVSAVDAVEALPRLDRCADVKLLRAVVPPPDDPAVRAEVETVRRQAAEIRALNSAGHSRQALERASRLAATARHTDYPPALADALIALGVVEEETGNSARAAATMLQALSAAIAGRDDELAALAAVHLSGTIGYDLARYDEFESWSTLASALLTRLDARHDWLRAWWFQNRGSVLFKQARFVEAEDQLRRGLALTERIDGPYHLQVARPLMGIAAIKIETGDAPAALPLLTRAIDVFERGYGRGHPLLASVLNNQGEALNALHQPAQALAVFERALAIWAQEHDSHDPRRAYALTGQGISLLELGRIDQAIRALASALTIREEGDPDPIPLAETRFAMARALWANGKTAQARALAASAQGTYATSPGLTRRRSEIESWLADHVR